MTIKYRSDIDGLRALAVIPVILYHFGLDGVAGFSVARGGFVGVDVFFVISGFLISKVIFDQVVSGSYDVVGFYTRRAKRIFPALFAVYLFCLVASAITGIGKETSEVRNSIISSLLFVSNIYFSGQAGYFGGALDSNPLLHTWSLSVEEQFYIFFPLILFALRKFSLKTSLLIVFALLTLSLGWSEYQVRVSPDSAYYALTTRAWELLVGSILAIGNLRALPRHAAEIAGLLGILLLVVSIRFYDKSTPFPGAAALVPCLGTALVIFSGTERLTLVSKVLSWGPLRFTGLISYSLYLWHWPLVVFYRLNFGTHKLAMIGLLVGCYAISVFSWRYIEQPARRLPNAGSRIAVLRVGAIGMVVIAIFAVIAVPANGLINPLTAESRRIEEFSTAYKPDAIMRTGKCFLTGQFNSLSNYDRQACLKSVPGKRTVLLMGDSHSAQYWAAFQSSLPGMQVMQASSSGCLPLYDVRGEKRCRDLWQYITDDYLPRNHVDSIVIVGLWRVDSIPGVLQTAERLKSFADHVYVVGPNPTYDLPFPRLLILNAQGDHSAISRHEDPEVKKIEARLSATSWPSGVSYLSYYKGVCPRMSCPSVASDGNPTTFDINHLTLAAATDVTKRWVAQGQFVVARESPLPSPTDGDQK